MRQETVHDAEENVDLRTLAVQLYKAEQAGNMDLFHRLLRGEEREPVVDKRIAILLAAGPASVRAVTDVLQSDSLSDIEKLDFLFGEFADQNSDAVFEVEAFGFGESFLGMGLALKVLSMPPETEAVFAMPTLPQHYRDLEYPHRSRKSALRSAGNSKKVKKR